MEKTRFAVRTLLAVVLGMLVLVRASAIQLPRVAAEQPAAGLSCRAPRDAAERVQCAGLERRILAATIFLRFTLHCGHNGDRSQVALIPSHATILDSRTLLTHNHFYPLADPDCAAVALELAQATGARLAVIEDAATLTGLVAQLRPNPVGSSNQTRLVHFPMPLFTPAPALTFEAIDRAASRAIFGYSGELAEINWEAFPNATRVQWVRPVALERRGDALGLVVDQAVEIGASGGGLFRVTPAGLVHVGNIWGTWREDDTSIIALNQN